VGLLHLVGSKVLSLLFAFLTGSCVALFVGRLLCYKQINSFSTATHPRTYLPHVGSGSLCLPRHCIFTFYTDSRAVAQSKVGVSCRPHFPPSVKAQLLGYVSLAPRVSHASSAWLENASCKMRRVKQIEKCCTWLGKLK